MTHPIEKFIQKGSMAQKAVDEHMPPQKLTPSELEAARTAERETWEQCKMVVDALKKAGNKLAELVCRKGPVDEKEKLAALKDWDLQQ